ncbi:MAG TPA: glycine betaine ABC transporter substrate-binding protein [Gemmatimonadales bacterium]|nr:glycine betaine ABC transporter substrate-binding protein [Gemmatimonadales bacterium]
MSALWVMLGQLALLTSLSAPQNPGPRQVVVASKPFGESYLLAEMFAQLLEARGFEVDRRLGLGATEITFEALRANAIDAYPEYTGTGLLAILGELPAKDPQSVYQKVAREFRDRWGVRWLPPLGFQNTYAIAVRRETARRLRLTTLSDLARVSRALKAGLTPDFIGRPDGLPGLQKAYGIRFRSVRALVPAVKYQALAAGEVDVIDGYSTDGFIARYDLVVLEDDRAFFPPYEAAAVISAGLQRELPAAVTALTELSGLLTESDMRSLNRRVEVDGIPVQRVAAGKLFALGLVRAAPGGPRRGEEDASTGGVLSYLWGQRETILSLTLRHLLLVTVSLAGAIAVALPLGLALERSRAAAEPVIRSVGLLQTLPSIALLAFMIPLLGIGVVPALVALFLYSLYPILRNTYTGVRDAAPDAVGAAWALGMTPSQVLRDVRLPLAGPIIMAGIRTAAVINVGTATLAAFIGAGGLGDPIAAGLALSDTRMILSGALPAALLALLVDGVLGICERLMRPGG